MLMSINPFDTVNTCRHFTNWLRFLIKYVVVATSFFYFDTMHSGLLAMTERIERWSITAITHMPYSSFHADFEVMFF